MWGVYHKRNRGDGMKIAITALLIGLIIVSGCIDNTNNTMQANAGGATIETADNDVPQNLNEQDRAMIEHCKFMPQMPGCEKYAGMGSGETESAFFSTATEGLDFTRETTVYSPSDGSEITISAGYVKKEIAGNEIRMLAYNGMVPGPTIKVKQGSSLTIEFVNNLDEETTVHWHGIRLKNEFDGVPGVTQEAIKPGEKFTYALEFPDAGVYWYHPHVREDYQQELGLYGNIIVEPKEEDYFSPANREETLILDDILIEKGGTDFYREIVDHALMGRFGNTMLVNGSDNYKLEVNKGEVVRFFVTNAANTRPFRLAFENAEMKLVGGDSGRFEKEEFIESVIIAPSERYIVEVHFAKEGEHGILSATPEGTTRLGTVVVSPEEIRENHYAGHEPRKHGDGHGAR